MALWLVAICRIEIDTIGLLLEQVRSIWVPCNATWACAAALGSGAALSSFDRPVLLLVGCWALLRAFKELEDWCIGYDEDICADRAAMPGKYWLVALTAVASWAVVSWARQ